MTLPDDLSRWNQWAHFGDGASALIIRKGTRYHAQNGLMYWWFDFLPDKALIERYDLGVRLRPDGTVRQVYPEYEVNPVRQESDEHGPDERFIIETDFDGRPTPMSRKEERLKLVIAELGRRVQGFELLLATLRRDLDVMAASPLQFVQRYSLALQEAAKAVAPPVSEEALAGGDQESGG